MDSNSLLQLRDAADISGQSSSAQSAQLLPSARSAELVPRPAISTEISTEELERNAASACNLLLDTRGARNGAEGTPQAASATAEPTRPYLGIVAKLSRAFLGDSLVPLVLLIISLLLNQSWIETKVDTAIQALETGCRGMESSSSALLSVTHTAASAVNAQVTQAVSGTIGAVATLLRAIITIVQFVLLFVIARWQATLRCLLETVMQATVQGVSQNAANITAFLQTRLAETQSTLDSALATVNTQLAIAGALVNAGGGTTQDAINTLTQGVNVGISVIQALGGSGGSGGNSATSVNISFTPLDMPTIDGLFASGAWTLPDGFESYLAGLASSVPTLDTLEQMANDQVDSLVSQLRQLVTDRFSTLQNQLGNLVVIPPPGTHGVTFCADALDTSALETVKEQLVWGIQIAVYVLLALVLTAIAAQAAMIWILHVVDRHRARQLANAQQQTEYTMELLTLYRHPIAYQLLLWATRTVPGVRRSKRATNLFKWFWVYIGDRQALILAATGILGIATLYMQLAVIDQVRQGEAAHALGASLENLGAVATSRISQTISGTAQVYATQANNRIADWENSVNTYVFGWVNETVAFIENGLDFVTGTIDNGIDDTLGGVPPLQSLAKQFVSCTLDRKLYFVSLVAEFAGENLRLALPRVNASALEVSNDMVAQQLDNSLAQMASRFMPSPPESLPWYQVVFSWTPPTAPSLRRHRRLARRQGIWNATASPPDNTTAQAPSLDGFPEPSAGNGSNTTASSALLGQSWQLDAAVTLGPAPAVGASSSNSSRDAVTALLDEYETVLRSQAWHMWMMCFLGMLIVWMGLLGVSLQAIWAMRICGESEPAARRFLGLV